MTPAPVQHRHTFATATIRLQSGPTSGGRCPCGVEVVGPQTAPFRLNAEVVRAGEAFNRAAVDGLAEIGPPSSRCRVPLMGAKVGDRSRCLRCGGKIVLIHHPRVISLDTGLWVHSGAIRRAAAAHPAEGPS